MNVTRNKVIVSIGLYSESSRMASSPISCDVILGKKLCAKHKETIDCVKNIVKIVHLHERLTIRAFASSDSEISVNAVKLKDKIPEVVAIALKPLDKSISLVMHRDISSLIHEYHDFFPDKLPNCLPPSRGKDFSTELITDARPQSRDIFRISQSELEQEQKNLSGLVEQDFIRHSSIFLGAPVPFAIKRTYTYRFCVDYRALNRLTVKNRFPLS